MITMYRKLLAPLDRTPGLPLLLVRVVVGLLFIDHGLTKYQATGGLKGFEFFLTSLKNIPDPAMTSRIVPLLEVAGGALLIIGLVSRVVAALLAAEMITTGFLVKSHDLHVPIISSTAAGVELDIVYLVTLLVVVMLGPGSVSLDAALRVEGPVLRPLSDQADVASGSVGARSATVS